MPSSTPSSPSQPSPSSSSSKGHSIKEIVIGSRSSSLAMIQTNFVMDRLKELHAGTDFTFRVYQMQTKGDRILDTPLPLIGDKGLFTQELEEALINHEVDFIVHSLKDLPTSLPDGCCIGAILEREDPNDALILRDGSKVKDPMTLLSRSSSDHPAVVGTSSLRRTSQLKHLNSSIHHEDMRGNLTTRMDKLDGKRGDIHFDALILAVAGMKRAGYGHRISCSIPNFLYAVGQGALAIECRTNDDRINHILRPLIHLKTVYETVAERSLLFHLEGGCSVPIGVRCTWDQETSSHLTMEGGIFSVDGSIAIRDQETVTLLVDTAEHPAITPTLREEVKNLQCPSNITTIDDKGDEPLKVLKPPCPSLLTGMVIPIYCPVLKRNLNIAWCLGKSLSLSLSAKGGVDILNDIKAQRKKK